MATGEGQSAFPLAHFIRVANLRVLSAWQARCRSAIRGERAKSLPRTHEKIRAAPMFSVTCASSTAPVGSPRRGHMLMSLFWIPKSRHLQSLATRFFPSTVPETQRGIRGRSSYFVRLPFLPLPVQRLLSRFTRVPIIQCEYSYDRQADRSLTQSQRAP